MQVREIAIKEHDAWNELLRAAPEANVFARADWLQMVCDTDPALAVRRLGCFEGDRLVGGQFVCHKRLWGLELATDFEFFYSGPFVRPSRKASHYHQASHRFRVLTALAAAMGDGLAELHWDAHPALRDARPFAYAGYQVHATYTHIWDMADAEATWLDMHREKRREIRNAQETYAFDLENTHEALDAMLPLYCATMAKFHWWPSPQWAAQLHERFQWMIERDGCRLYTARAADGELAAGCLALLSREDGTAYLWRQGSGEAHVQQGVVPALYWHIASELAGDFQQVNFGGSPDPSLSRFKDYLGARAVPHYQISRCDQPLPMALADAAQQVKDKAHNAAMRLAEGPIQAWKRRRLRRRQVDVGWQGGD